MSGYRLSLVGLFFGWDRSVRWTVPFVLSPDRSVHSTNGLWTVRNGLLTVYERLGTVYSERSGTIGNGLRTVWDRSYHSWPFVPFLTVHTIPDCSWPSTNGQERSMNRTNGWPIFPRPFRSVQPFVPKFQDRSVHRSVPFQDRYRKNRPSLRSSMRHKSRL